MNKQPISYLQTDARWKNTRLPCVGGAMSVGGGGCGPTSAAMLIETLTGKQCLPTETFKWCCDHKYMYANQGTSYDYFRPQFAAYDINCDLLTWTQCMSAKSPVRDKVIAMLKQGYYFIALMKKGLWTSGGHYVVVWEADNKIRINDPASTKKERLNGDPDTFFSQAKYFWWVDALLFNKKRTEDDMDVSKLTGEQAYEILLKANEYAASLATPEWMKKELQEAVDMGITDGTRPLATVQRGAAAIMAKRAMEGKNG